DEDRAMPGRHSRSRQLCAMPPALRETKVHLVAELTQPCGRGLCGTHAAAATGGRVGYQGPG
ncbi:MAG: hypothetical protein QF689_08625, partial [Candidatus Latescibacteria bacterium]|nr:hypothetical protein [Candidatus Latescibacterota bacterium]